MRDRHLFTHRTWWFAGIEQKAPQSTYQYWLAPEVGWDGFEVEMVVLGHLFGRGALGRCRSTASEANGVRLILFAFLAAGLCWNQGSAWLAD